MIRRFALFLILLPAPALAQGLSCPSGGGHLAPQALCAAVGQALGGQSAPGLALDVVSNDPQKLAARLTWGGGAGPVVEVTANDRALDARAADRLARGLMAVTRLP